ncbi:MAG: hypothetical protein NTY01_11235 [Verrucomicrobia bacterium]|nr:hypothetical protein [Verrucomicrobiota bacterium]
MAQRDIAYAKADRYDEATARAIESLVAVALKENDFAREAEGSGLLRVSQLCPRVCVAADNPKAVVPTAVQSLRLHGSSRLVRQHGAVVQVWAGVKSGGNDPAGLYTRLSGCDPLASLTVEAAA